MIDFANFGEFRTPFESLFSDVHSPPSLLDGLFILHFPSSSPPPLLHI